MITLRQMIEAELNQQPDLLYWLQEGLVNITSLARYMRPAIQKQTGEIVGLESISMSIRRLLQDKKQKIQKGIRAPHAKNIQVQLDVAILTFDKTSPPQLAQGHNYRFFSFAQGHSESMLAVSQEDESKFKISATRIQKNMAALTVTLNNETSKTVGAYGYIVLLLAIAGIPLAEVVTLHDDITVLVADQHVDRAFQILRKALKNQQR